MSCLLLSNRSVYVLSGQFDDAGELNIQDHKPIPLKQPRAIHLLDHFFQTPFLECEFPSGFSGLKTISRSPHAIVYGQFNNSVLSQVIKLIRNRTGAEVDYLNEKRIQLQLKSISTVAKIAKYYDSFRCLIIMK